MMPPARHRDGGRAPTPHHHRPRLAVPDHRARALLHPRKRHVSFKLRGIALPRAGPAMTDDRQQARALRVARGTTDTRAAGRRPTGRILLTDFEAARCGHGAAGSARHHHGARGGGSRTHRRNCRDLIAKERPAPLAAYGPRSPPRWRRAVLHDHSAHDPVRSPDWPWGWHARADACAAAASVVSGRGGGPAPGAADLMGTPRVGLDEVAVPQVAAGGPGQHLGRGSRGGAMAQEPAVDIRHECVMPPGQAGQRGVECPQHRRALWPGRQQPGGISVAGAIAGVINRGDHDPGAAGRVQPGQDL